MCGLQRPAHCRSCSAHPSPRRPAFKDAHEHEKASFAHHLCSSPAATAQVSSDTRRQLLSEGELAESDFADAGERYIKGKGIMSTALVKVRRLSTPPAIVAAKRGKVGISSFTRDCSFGILLGFVSNPAARSKLKPR